MTVDAKIIVNAFLTKCLDLSQRWSIRFLNAGKRYAGNSIMNGGVSPRIVVFRIKSTAQTAIIIPARYIERVMTSTFPTPNTSKIPPAIAVRMGSFAPQEKKGITLIVAVLSFSSARVRVFIIAGSEQPKPIIIGINALPESPKRRKILSSTNAILAIYPVSSKIEKPKNRNSI